MESIIISEFIGTCVLILLGNGIVANCVLPDTKASGSGWICITTAWAFAVYAGVTIAGPYSGAHINPAVTIALAVAGSLEWAVVPQYLIGEFGGAMFGALLVWLFYKDHFKRSTDEGANLACFSTGPAIKNLPSNLFSEIIGTIVLLLGVFFIKAPEIQIPSIEGATMGLGSMGALPISIFVWVIGLSLGGTTGYAINPARDLGPRIIHALVPLKGSSDWSYSWIPVVGPIIGACIAALLYTVL